MPPAPSLTIRKAGGRGGGGVVVAFDDEIAAHLTAVLREALSNVVRHADADRVRVEVGDHVTLAVADNGRGVPDEVLGGNGLTNMASRARDLGGRLDVTPNPAAAPCWSGGYHHTRRHLDPRDVPAHRRDRRSKRIRPAAGGSARRDSTSGPVARARRHRARR